MNDTIVAIATPVGIGAIGVIRLSGPEALSIAQAVFSKPILDKASHTLHFGKIQVPDEENKPQSALNRNRTTLDEVVLSIFKNPHSYTGEDVIELSCHGSPFI